jgi:hypothetical protein
MTPWEATYGWIACTDPKLPLTWKCWESPKHGKCLLINGGGPVPTRNPNHNHNMKYIAVDVEMHKGETKEWRGSAACITYPPDIADIIDFFELNESGILSIVDYSKMGKETIV